MDWQTQGGMSRRLSAATVNYGSRAGALGLAESDGGIQAYHAPLSQTFAAVDFDMQVSVLDALLQIRRRRLVDKRCVLS